LKLCNIGATATGETMIEATTAIAAVGTKGNADIATDAPATAATTTVSGTLWPHSVLPLSLEGQSPASRARVAAATCSGAQIAISPIVPTTTRIHRALVFVPGVTRLIDQRRRA
jgi:hypothetical protein